MNSTVPPGGTTTGDVLPLIVWPGAGFTKTGFGPVFVTVTVWPLVGDDGSVKFMVPPLESTATAMLPFASGVTVLKSVSVVSGAVPVTVAALSATNDDAVVSMELPGSLNAAMVCTAGTGPTTGTWAIIAEPGTVVPSTTVVPPPAVMTHVPLTCEMWMLVVVVWTGGSVTLFAPLPMIGVMRYCPLDKPGIRFWIVTPASIWLWFDPELLAATIPTVATPSGVNVAVTEWVKLPVRVSILRAECAHCEVTQDTSQINFGFELTAGQFDEKYPPTAISGWFVIGSIAPVWKWIGTSMQFA